MTQEWKVDFICIGAMKSGTTFLYNVLDETGKFDLSTLKEPCFYTENYHYGYTWYKSLWANNNKPKAEFSAHYFYSPKALKTIKEEQPDCKIILILRNPYDRAVSHLKHLYRIGKITDLHDLDTVKEKVIERSLYYKYLTNLFEIFEPQNIKILYFDDIKNNLEKVNAELKNYLNMADLKINNTLSQTGEGYIPKYVIFEKLKNFIYYSLVKLNLTRLVKYLTGSKISTVYKKLNKSSDFKNEKLHDTIKHFSNEILEDLSKIKQCEHLKVDDYILSKWISSIEKKIGQIQ